VGYYWVYWDIIGCSGMFSKYSRMLLGLVGCHWINRMFSWFH